VSGCISKKLLENGWLNLQPLFGFSSGGIFSHSRFVYLKNRSKNQQKAGEI